ncbi:MAG: hypothetical protein RIM84_12745 [Alphaproteobacteria bacterium]
MHESAFRRWCRRLVILLGCAIATPAQSMDMISGLLGGDETASEDGEANGEASADAEGSVNDGNVYIQIDSLTAPVIVRQRVRHHILLTLSLEVPSMSDKNQVARVMPRLRDAMLRDLYASPIVHTEDSGHLDMEGLRERMIAVARATIGTDMVKDILIVRAMRSS